MSDTVLPREWQALHAPAEGLMTDKAALTSLFVGQCSDAMSGAVWRSRQRAGLAPRLSPGVAAPTCPSRGTCKPAPSSSSARRSRQADRSRTGYRGASQPHPLLPKPALRAGSLTSMRPGKSQLRRMYRTAGPPPRCQVTATLECHLQMHCMW